MAYNELGIRIGGAGHDAAELVAAMIAAGKVEPYDAVDMFKDVLRGVFDALNTLEEAEGGSKPAAAPSVASETSGGGGFVPKIIGKNAFPDEPIPAWLGPAMQACGATAVFDNRKDKDGNDIRSTNRPWFKTPPQPRDGGPADKPFWPPRD